jgi:hypothetical protein
VQQQKIRFLASHIAGADLPRGRRASGNWFFGIRFAKQHLAGHSLHFSLLAGKMLTLGLVHDARKKETDTSAARCRR